MATPLAIIIPVYNEGANIGATIEAIESRIKTPHTITIVYDFDEDDTVPVVKELKANGAPIELLKNSEGGAVNAIRKGLREASGEALLVTMADLSDDYTVVDRMCSLMKDGYDVVCGSRYMRGGRQVGGPLVKKTISRLVGLSLYYLTGVPTRDATNSFKLYNKKYLDTIDIESDGGFEIGLEVVVKAHFSGKKVTEIPCTWFDRSAGESRFQVIGWAPNYLKWYFYAFKKRFFRA